MIGNLSLDRIGKQLADIQWAWRGACSGD